MADGVVGRTKWPLENEGSVCGPHSRNAVDFRHIQSLFDQHTRENRGGSCRIPKLVSLVTELVSLYPRISVTTPNLELVRREAKHSGKSTPGMNRGSRYKTCEI